MFAFMQIRKVGEGEYEIALFVLVAQSQYGT